MQVNAKMKNDIKRCKNNVNNVKSLKSNKCKLEQNFKCNKLIKDTKVIYIIYK